MNIARSFYYFLTPTLRFWARRIFYFPYDLYVSLFNKKDKLAPPKGMVFIGSGDFIKQGEHLSELVIQYAQLKPNGKILDVGCGIGRLAVPLTKYLNKDGIYVGFDIVEFGINWCKKNITSKYPNFHFLFVDLKNDLYNLSTNKEAKDFEFPYPKDYFDTVVLTSVFTHMMPLDVKQYLKQIFLVLKSGGKCLATFFIINEEVKRNMNEKKSNFVFSHSYDGYYLMDSSVKEANVAFDEEYLRTMIKDCGLSIESIYYGSWSCKKEALDFQDVIVLGKE